MPKRGGWLAGGLVAVALVAVAIGVLAFGSRDTVSCDEDTATSNGVNAVRRISTTETGIEIEVFSEVPFPVRAMPPLLQIGDREFGLSRYPDTGSLNTLIFRIPPNDFAELTSQDPVFVHHGFFLDDLDATVEVAGQGGTWTFGTLTKELLDCVSTDV